MKQVVAGILCTSIICVLFYSVNQPGAMEDPSELIIINIMFAFFLLIGISCFLYGVRSLVLDHKTKKYGKKGLAVLVNVEHTGTSVADDVRDEVDYYDAIFLVLEETGKCKFYRLDVDSSGPSFERGEYYDVLYYKNHLVLGSLLHKNDIPSDKRTALDEAMIACDGKYSV